MAGCKEREERRRLRAKLAEDAAAEESNRARTPLPLQYKRVLEY